MENNISNITKHDDNLKWIVTNHSKIYDYIKNSYKNDNTKKGHISVLAGILRSLNVRPRIMKKYNDESIKLLKEIQDSSKHQELLPQRVHIYITFRDTEKRRDELGSLYNLNKSNNKYNLMYLLLSLYTYQPLLRMH